MAFLTLLALPAAGQDRNESFCSDTSGNLPAAEVMAACNALVANTSFTRNFRARAHTWRGLAHQRANSTDAALADFDAAITLDADSVLARYRRAQIHYNARKYEAALADMDVAVRLEPESAALLMLRSAIYLGLKRYDEAIADADNPRFFGGVTVLCQRCWARAVAGVELDKARTACDQALWITPDNAAVLDSRALVSLKQKRFDLALSDYDAILKRFPRNASALYGRGIAAMGLGRQKEGQNDLAMAIAANKNIAATYADIGMTP